jgi:hypothetical protein
MFGEGKKMTDPPRGADHDAADPSPATGSDSPLIGDVHSDILSHMLNGVAYCRMLFKDGKPEDFVYLHTNPAFHTQTGLGNVVGKRVSEVIPGVRESDPTLFEIYGRVASGGASETFQTYVLGLQQSKSSVPTLNTSLRSSTSSRVASSTKRHCSRRRSDSKSRSARPGPASGTGTS